MAETETETSGHTHTDVHDASSIHATMAANHRTQMRLVWAILIVLGLMMWHLVGVALADAHRLAQIEIDAGTAAARARACAPLTAGCVTTGSGGVVADVTCTVPLQCTIIGHGGNAAPVDGGRTTGHDGSGATPHPHPVRVGRVAIGDGVTAVR